MRKYDKVFKCVAAFFSFFHTIFDALQAAVRFMADFGFRDILAVVSLLKQLCNFFHTSLLTVFLHTLNAPTAS